MKVVYKECLKVCQIASVDARNELLAYLSTLRMRMIPVSRKLLMEAEELVRWRQDCFLPTEQRLSGSDEPANH